MHARVRVPSAAWAYAGVGSVRNCVLLQKSLCQPPLANVVQMGLCRFVYVHVVSPATRTDNRSADLTLSAALGEGQRVLTSRIPGLVRCSLHGGDVSDLRPCH